MEDRQHHDAASPTRGRDFPLHKRGGGGVLYYYYCSNDEKQAPRAIKPMLVVPCAISTTDAGDTK